MTEAPTPHDGRAPTGIDGLDEVLRGGLVAHRTYLVQGVPGAGKTTLALQFLLEGRRRGERTLYVALSESIDEIHATAASHGLDLDGVDLFALGAPEGEDAAAEGEYTIFLPAEVELPGTTKRLLDEIDRAKPRRVVVDSLSELRLLARDPLRYRRQVLALKQHLVGRACTALLLDDRSDGEESLQLQSIAHGVIVLEVRATDYGAERRVLQVLKMRGTTFRGGFHDYAIRHGGLVVFPRVIAAAHRGVVFEPGVASSGAPGLDGLLCGGLPRGSSTLFLGPAGSGKSTTCTLFVHAACARGERATLYAFDESERAILARAAGLGLDLAPFLADGRLTIRQVDPAELSPGELSAALRDEEERRGARVVCIDSLSGYLNAMPGERHLALQLHELLAYLGQHGVVTLMTLTQHGVVGSLAAPLDISYLADAVVALRFFESAGEVRKAISVIKQRVGPRETTLRELCLAPGSITIGAPLREFSGVLTWTPEYRGARTELGAERA
jgi:circadian clock protein KaiC